MADRLYGAYRAIIGSTGDPTGGNRVQVRIPAVLGGATSWAKVCQPFGVAAGAPRIGSEVLVVFEAGDPTAPYVIGSIW